MKRFHATVAAVALVAGSMGLSPAPAQEETATYVVNGVVTANLPGQVGVGGFIFPAGAKPKKIQIEDFTGQDFEVTVCQNIPPAEAAPDPCGDGNDHSITFCTSGDVVKLGQGFVPDVAVAVFIPAQGLDCAGQGSAGTITLTR